MELLENNDLGLNLTDLLCDNPLCHLLEYSQSLLDDHDRLRVAHEGAGFLFRDSLGE